MDEKDLIKKAIEENIINKQDIRRAALNSAQKGNRQIRGGIFMKKRIIIVAVIVVMLSVGSVSAFAAVDTYQYNQADSFLNTIGIEADSMSRSDAKKVYKDIKSDTFKYQVTIDALDTRAVELGIDSVSKSGKEIYNAINDSLIDITNITSDQIKEIKAGTSYKDIIGILGKTKEVGSGRHVLQYSVDGNKILYLAYTYENDICNQSGEELLKTLVDAN